jgi:tetrahydromethanopterin S-methyltransferase subunit G
MLPHAPAARCCWPVGGQPVGGQLPGRADASAVLDSRALAGNVVGVMLFRVEAWLSMAWRGPAGLLLAGRDADADARRRAGGGCGRDAGLRAGVYLGLQPMMARCAKRRDRPG